MPQEKDLLALPLKLIRFGGFLKKQTFMNKFVIYSSFLMLVTCELLMITGFLVFELTVENIAALLEGIGSWFQGAVRLSTLMVFNEDLQQILKLRKRFWDLGIFGKEIEEQNNFYPNITYKIIKVYVYYTAFTVTLISFKPLILHQLIMKCWVPDGEIWFALVYFMQLETAIFASIVIVGFDGFFCLLYMQTTVQFKLLNLALSRMENIEDIKKCVTHQDFLYKFVRKINRLFSVFLLVQYFITMVVTCMQLLIIIDPLQDVAIKAKGVLYIIDMLFQLSFYCAPASLLQDEVDGAAVSVWMCNWHLKSKEFQQHIIFMLKMSQRKISVKAGGILEMDRKAFINVYRSCFSIFTLFTSEKH